MCKRFQQFGPHNDNGTGRGSEAPGRRCDGLNGGPAWSLQPGSTAEEEEEARSGGTLQDSLSDAPSGDQRNASPRRGGTERAAFQLTASIKNNVQIQCFDLFVCLSVFMFY